MAASWTRYSVAESSSQRIVAPKGAEILGELGSF
jgi:hypothetical protein